MDDNPSAAAQQKSIVDARTVDRSGRAQLALRWGIVVACIAVGYSSVMPPGSLPLDAGASRFSASRALEHVEVIAREPHPMGSAANAEVRAYLVSELEEMGLRPSLQMLTVPSYFEPGGTRQVVNIMATIPGTASTGAIALMAHYDTFPTTPGANDNAAAVATLLETGRALLAGATLRNDVILLMTDGEEPAPRYGSTAFLADGASEEIALVMNFEANGNSGPSMLVETSGPESGLVAQFADAVSNPTAFSFVGETVSLIGDIGTDFDPFREAGVPGFHVAYLRGSPIYHTPADVPSSVSADSVQHHGSNAVGIARRFGDLDLGTLRDTDGSVYFTLRPYFVQYPAWLSIAAALAAAIMLVRGFRHSVPRRRPDVRAIVGTGGRTVAAVLVVVLAQTLLWILIVSVRSTPSVTESYAYLVGLVGCGAAAWAWLRPAWSPRAEGHRGGFVATWVVLGLLTAVIAPGFSYLFVWPALAAAAAVNWTPRSHSYMGSIRFAAVAGPAVILMIPAIEFFFQFGQPRPGNPDSSLPVVAGVAFLLAFLVSGLLGEIWRDTTTNSDAGGTSVVAEPSSRPMRLPWPGRSTRDRVRHRCSAVAVRECRSYLVRWGLGRKTRVERSGCPCLAQWCRRW